MGLVVFVTPFMLWLSLAIRRSRRGNHAARTHTATRTNAVERLIDNNPTLNVVNVRWSVAARRVRIGWVTSLVVAIAVLVVADRPRDNLDH